MLKLSVESKKERQDKISLSVRVFV